MRSRKSRLVLFLGGNGICDRGLALALGGIRAVGLNATDTKCIGLILSHPDRTMTAGELAEKTGLTTGAITHILDRLGRRRFIKSVRDIGDRRKVFVQVRPESLEPPLRKYEEIGKAYTALAEDLSEDELAVICDTERATAISAQQLAHVVKGWRDRSASKRQIQTNLAQGGTRQSR